MDNGKSVWRSPLFYIRLFGSLLAAGLVVYLFAKRWDEIAGAFQQIPVQVLGLALVLMVISRLAVAVRWHYLLRGAGLPVPAGQTVRINFAGLFANNFLPTTIGGDVARLAGILLLGYDRAVCLASLVVDRLVGMGTMAMILPFALPALLGGGSADLVPSVQPLAAMGVVGALRKPWEKGIYLLQRLWQALALWKNSPISLLEAAVFSWVHMLCWIAIQILLMHSMGQQISPWLIAGLWSATYFIQQLPVSINGWGVTEGATILLFTRFGSVSMESATVLALSLRILQMLASLPGALFFSGVFTGAGRERKRAG